MTESIPIKVYGTPCGGTQFATRVLRAFGYDVGHEKPEEQGIVCGFMALGLRAQRRGRVYERTQKPLPSHVDNRPATMTGHLIRHPFEVVETLWRYVDRAQLDVRRSGIAHPSLDQTTEALRWWVLTHEAVPASAWRIRLEEGRNQGADWDLFLSVVAGWVSPGLPTEAPTPASAVELANRGRTHKLARKPRLTWEQWDARDPEMAERGRNLLEHYAMSIEPTSLP